MVWEVYGFYYISISIVIVLLTCVRSFKAGAVSAARREQRMKSVLLLLSVCRARARIHVIR